MTTRNRIPLLAAGATLLAATPACIDTTDDADASVSSAVSYTIPRAVKLNRRGWVDTDVAMGEFADQEHTVMAWVMPEFTFAAWNDMFSSTGSAYVVGMDDYRMGNGDYGLAGAPVLVMKVGGKTARYLAPGFTKRTWHHVAFRRTPANRYGVMTFQLFVDGTRLIPKTITKTDTNQDGKYQADEVTVTDAPEISFTLSAPPPAFSTGALRIGPRPGTPNYFYGLVDTVAVYTRTVPAAEIQEVAQGSALSADGLIAYYTFDGSSEPPGSSPPDVPAYSTRGYSLNETPWAKLVARASLSSETLDATIFDSAEHGSPTEATYRLPFGVGEEWVVTQGYDDVDGSHNGKSAFAFDFKRASGGPGMTRAAASGDVYWFADDLPLSSGREANWLRLATAPHESLTYLHLAQDFSDALGFSTPDPNNPATWSPMSAYSAIGEYGPNANHLHLGTTNEYQASATWRPMPIAFVEYYVEGRSGWTYVARGQPRAGQKIKRQW